MNPVTRRSLVVGARYDSPDLPLCEHWDGRGQSRKLGATVRGPEWGHGHEPMHRPGPSFETPPPFHPPLAEEGREGAPQDEGFEAQPVIPQRGCHFGSGPTRDVVYRSIVMASCYQHRL
jgi:hypothetical protein